ncbi:histidine kinase [Tenacibaculum ovolyticum]|uniref:histidine kinase n=1 Tax=Tenacibaculum ovolyticum TaxID=104270 RepID=UPI0022F3C5D2|nr:histidine kinase [Tenacibaculum ovolyticum]WBX78259.1 histidine kinase [Tenacibaculum ovolyticum]
MKISHVNTLILFLISILFISCSEKEYFDNGEIPDSFKRGETVYRLGDDLSWGKTSLNDSLWSKKIEIKEDKIFWSRTNVEILKAPKDLNQYGILLNQHGEFEVFWDGILIGKNGNPNNSLNSNKTGKMISTFMIPRKLSAKGNHKLVIRNSIHYYLDYSEHLYFYISDYDKIIQREIKTTVFIHIFAGVFLMAALYFFLQFINNLKSYTALILSINCLLFFLLIIFEYMRSYIDIHYSYHHTRLEIIGIITFLISLLTPVYFSLQFKFSEKNKILSLYALILLYIFIREHENHDFTAYNMIIFMWYISLFIVIYGVLKKMNGAKIVLISMLTSVYFHYATNYDSSIHFGFSVILLGMFYILSLRTKEQRLAYENSLVQSTRLKLELLKKSIQPHFLMNTLTSLIDWIEEAPDKGVLFIEALADEFDVLNQVENETLIPISQEIKLCKSHINIMKFRKEINYIWEDEGVNKNIAQLIPPAVIHTLLENSITHCLPSNKGEMRFKLLVLTTKNTQEYKFLTFGKVRNKQKSTADGTGFKYIKARLTESYKDNWTFTSSATTEGWKNTIKIQK